jgi:hypothetical protein
MGLVDDDRLPCCFCCCCFMKREADKAPMVVVKGVIETNWDARIASL